MNTGAWMADIVQVGLYMSLLQEGNMPSHEARIYYREDRKSVNVAWSDELASLLEEVVAQCRSTAAQAIPPAPLAYSTKCPRCSLVSICLPLEHHALLKENLSSPESHPNVHCDADLENELQVKPTLPQLIPGRDDVSTVHVCSPGSTVRKKGDSIEVCKRDGSRVKILGKDIGQLAIYGPSQITHQCMLYLTEMGVGITHHSSAGRLVATTNAPSTKNIQLRRAQFRRADDSVACLAIAKNIVLAKVRNQRTLLRRYRRIVENREKQEALPDWALSEQENKTAKETVPDSKVIPDAMAHLRTCIHAIPRAQDLNALRGHEGVAAARYFSSIPSILPRDWKSEFNGRSRRPPRDKVNALLGFGYALLVKDAVNAIVGAGLDPMLGFLHTMIAGRPALALDVMEPFRPAWVDVAVVRLIATNGISKTHFDCSSLGVFLTDAGRRRMISAYERRADEEVSHHHFGYRMSYRRMLALEVRILAKFILGETESYPAFLTR